MFSYTGTKPPIADNDTLGWEAYPLINNYMQFIYVEFYNALLILFIINCILYYNMAFIYLFFKNVIKLNFV